MNIDIDFSELDKIRNKMGAPLLKKTKVKIENTILEILKSEDGVEIDIDEDIELGSDNEFIHKETGKPILLYIREPNGNIPKFHIANCSTIRGYKEKGRIERYVAAYRDKENASDLFKVNLKQDDGKRKAELKKLEVCKNCLSELNYNNYRSKRNEVFQNFSILEFFEEFDTTLHYVSPDRQENDFKFDEYPADFENIKRKYKKNIGYSCEQCGINLAKNPRYLHLHHKNGYKGDNTNENLIALCIKCHASQPDHSHIKKMEDYKRFCDLFNK